MKKFLYATVISIFATFNLIAFEQPYFNGYTGFIATALNDESKDHFSPSYSGETFLAGQFDFGGKFFIRGEIYTKASDILETDTFKQENGNAYFRIEELSATYKANSQHASHYFSLYRGNFEPIGSDLFLQRQFGIAPIGSPLTSSFHGLEGVSFYPLYALGGGYVFHPDADVAFGVNLYKNEANKDDNQDDALNFDLRLASILGNSIFDFSAGLVFPTNDNDDDALIHINEVELHGGLNLLIGNRNTCSLLVQGGVNKLYLRKKSNNDDDIIDLKDIFGLVEARASGKYISIDSTGFIFPMNSAEDMIFLRTAIIKSPSAESFFGGNLNIHSDKIYLGATKVSAGAHATFAVSRTEELDSDDDDEYEYENSFTISPYAEIEILGGTLNASFSINVIEATKNPEKCYCASLGFKTSF